MAGHKKWLGVIFNVAQRRPEGWPPWMAGHKKWPGVIFNVAQRRPEGRLHGWQAIKNGRESFLTSRSDGPKGGRHGWQAIKILFRTLDKSAPSGPAAFKLRLPDAFCRISESAGFPRVGAIRSCRMAAMPSPDQSLQSFTSPASQCRCSLSGEPRCPFSTTRCNAPISTR